MHWCWPRSCHHNSHLYAIKTIWFQEEIHKRGNKLLKIDTKEQRLEIYSPRALLSPRLNIFVPKCLVGNALFLKFALVITSWRGSVDIGSVDLFQVPNFTVSLFSCTWVRSVCYTLLVMTIR